jgi:type IV pilus assembly protein PilC
MIDYNYKAKTKDGEVQTGVVNADTEYAAAKVLTSRDLFPIKIKRVETRGLTFSKKLSIKDKSFFMRQLATTINAGLPIAQALQVLNEQTSSVKLKAMITQVANDVEGGTSLSNALSEYPDTFSQIDLTLIESGETSGSLDKSLNRAADSIEDSYKLRKKIRGAMIYPMFVLVVVAGVLVVMSVYVMPQMAGLYANFNAKLPLMTRMVMYFSNHFPVIALACVIIGAVIYVGMKWLMRTYRSVRRVVDQFKLGIPVIKPFLKSLYLSRLTRTLEGLISSGVSIIEALRITARATGNVLYEDSLLDLAEQVKSGKQMSGIMRSQIDLYPPIVSQMINVGEQTGEMDAMLGNLANYFEEEVDNFVKNLTSIMEPVLIVVMALIVGVMLVSIMMPIYQFGSVVTK